MIFSEKGNGRKPVGGSRFVLSKVRKTIEEFAMLERGDRVVAAVSGGPDSVALLKALAMIAGEYDFSLMAAHLNHGLRGEESDREEDFVLTLCRGMGIEVVSKKVSLRLIEKRGGSLEDLCRNERYAFLKETAKERGATKIALGHHLHDQAETVLMNFLRGSGAEGLRGMLPVREGMFIRPLLKVFRHEILAFLEKEGLSFVSDSSNVQDFCLRNRIRHHLMPILKEGYNPRLEETLCRTAEIMRLDDEYMDCEAAVLLQRWGIACGKDENAIPIPALLNLHEALRSRVIKMALTWALPSGKGIGFKHVKAVAALAQGRGGCRSVNLPGGITVIREYDLLIVSQKADINENSGRRTPVSTEREKGHFCYILEIPGSVDIKESGATITFQFVEKPPSGYLSGKERIVYMDYEALHPPIVLRSVRPGDRFQPLGMAGNKKLKSFFIDEKIPRRLRGSIPILADRHSVLWIAGMRMGERAKITPETRRVLKIEIV